MSICGCLKGKCRVGVNLLVRVDVSAFRINPRSSTTGLSLQQVSKCPATFRHNEDMHNSGERLVSSLRDNYAAGVLAWKSDSLDRLKRYCGHEFYILLT